MGGTLDNKLKLDHAGVSTFARECGLERFGMGRVLVSSCTLLGFEGPDLVGAIAGSDTGGGVRGVVFWPGDHERVVMVFGTDRTLRTTQWTRASKRASSIPWLGVGDVPLVNMQRCGPALCGVWVVWLCVFL